MAPKKKTASNNVARGTLGSVNDYITQPALSRHGALLKSGGRVLTANFQWDMPGFKNPMEAGSVFKQCNDNYYQVFDSRGERTCFRVSEKIMEKVFGAGWDA